MFKSTLFPNTRSLLQKHRANLSIDSEGLEGDAEMELNEDMEERGEWEDEQKEIAAG